MASAKPPYPWKSLLSTAFAGLVVVALVLLAVVRSQAPGDRYTVFYPIALASFFGLHAWIRFIKFTSQLRAHRNLVEQTRREWRDEVAGPEALLRPAAESEVNLLIPASTQQADESILLRPDSQR